MAFGRLQAIRNISRGAEIGAFSSLLGSSRSYSNHIVNVPEVSSRRDVLCLCKGPNALPWTFGDTKTLCSAMAAKSSIFLGDMRLVTTQANAPAQARQMGALKVSMLSLGVIIEPYAPRKQISFWQRWFTKSGWIRTKEDIMLELKSAYAINQLRKSGYSKQKFYKEALDLYKEINTQIANGDKASLRKSVTEKLYSALKNEIRQRESMWSEVYWELLEPVVKIRTLRARMVAIDRDNMNKTFIQLTLEFVTKQDVMKEKLSICGHHNRTPWLSHFPDKFSTFTSPSPPLVNPSNCNNNALSSPPHTLNSLLYVQLNLVLLSFFFFCLIAFALLQVEVLYCGSFIAT